jgi:hypothetical protein
MGTGLEIVMSVSPLDTKILYDGELVEGVKYVKIEQSADGGLPHVELHVMPQSYKAVLESVGKMLVVEK